MAGPAQENGCGHVDADPYHTEYIYLPPDLKFVHSFLNIHDYSRLKGVVTNPKF